MRPLANELAQSLDTPPADAQIEFCIMTLKGDHGVTRELSVRWSRLSEQFLRIDKWSVCQG